MERTLSIIKPDGVERNLVGQIVAKFEENGLNVAAMKKIWLSKHEAESFYAVHKERPFFGELVDFMTRSPVVVMCLKGEGAVLKIVRSWVQQIRLKQPMALSVKCLQNQSVKTPFMAPMQPKLQKKKSHSSSLNLRSTNS